MLDRLTIRVCAFIYECVLPRAPRSASLELWLLTRGANAQRRLEEAILRSKLLALVEAVEATQGPEGLAMRAARRLARKREASS